MVTFLEVVIVTDDPSVVAVVEDKPVVAILFFYFDLDSTISKSISSIVNFFKVISTFFFNIFVKLPCQYHFDTLIDKLFQVFFFQTNIFS